ncbi:MAG: hypothetical protein ABIQ93_17065, partial [Saprospiraceae bacterium]
RATDVCGNSATCTQVITVFDNIAPVLTCPAPVTVQCAGDVPAPSTTTVTGVSDNCPGTVTVTFVGDVITPGSCTNRFTVTRTYRATDVCGNSATCTQVITVFDNIAPVLTCPGPVTVQCAGDVPAPNIALVTGVSDNCPGTVVVTFVSDVTTPGSCANRFTVTRTYRATDVCGNSATCTQVITVFDNIAPVLTCPGPVTVQCAGDVPAPNTALVTGVSDNCPGTVAVTFVSDVITPGSCANRFTVTRTYRATDVCGNSATCTQVITVFDNTAPTFVNLPPNVTVECFIVPPIPTALPAATDNCAGTPTVVFNGQVQTPGVCPVLYTLTRRFTATDACGNATTGTQVITVTDTFGPQFTQDPVDVILDCNIATNMAAYQNWLDTHGGAMVFDCSAVTWTYMDSPFHTCPSTCGGTFQKYIRFTATDQCGNSTFRDARFIVVDLTPPTFTVLPQNVEVECMADCNGEIDLYEWLDHFGYAQVSDNCGTVTTDLLFVSEKQGCGNTYSRIYQFRATDECGNTNYVTATFAVVDHTPPVIVKCPEGHFVDCALGVPGPDLAGVIATDNCGSVHISSMTFSTGTGCAWSPMTVSYWYMATDECGNMSSNCDQSFQVNDILAAVYTGPDTIPVVCAADLPGQDELAAALMPYMNDNCSSIFSFGNLETQSGPNSVTYSMTIKDQCGNVGPKFSVTFIATGGCKPLCSAPQSDWSQQASKIDGMSVPEAIEKLINQHGGVTAGKLGKTITVNSASCLLAMLTGDGNTAQFSPGNYSFGTANDCQESSPVLTAEGKLKNKLAANIMVLQLNIWYNQDINQRNLGMRKLSELPGCLINAKILAKLEPGQSTVQGLLNLANDYLAGVGSYPPDFGDLLNEALESVNTYWQNCEENDPCSADSRYGAANKMSQLSLAPNPVLDLVTISLVAAGDTELRVRFVGSSGLQSEEMISVVKGFNSLNFSTKNFPAGVYTVVLQDGKELQTLRMVKVKD